MNQQNIPSLSRRDFLAGSSAIAAGLAVSAAVAQVPSGDPNKKLGFAFVGIGSLCMNQLLPGIMKSKRCKPVALVSGHPDKARQQARKYGVNEKNIYNYENFDTIRDNPEIDVVYIVLPNGMHEEYTVRAFKAGKHVLCEKPMANSVKECQNMIAASKSANKRLQIGYRMHFEPNTLACIDAIKKQEVGKLQMIDAGAGFVIGDPKQWRLNKKLAGGGCLMDIGIYALNAARYLSGDEPTEVNAMTYTDRSDPRFKEVEEHCNFQLRFRGDVLASCISSYNTGLNRFVAHGTSGWCSMEPGLSYTGVKFHINRGRGGPQTPNIPEVDQFATEMDAFAECIASGAPSRASGEEGLQDLRIIEAIYESAETGKTVKL